MNQGKIKYNKIEKLKLSLMQLDKESDDHKSDFIVKTTAIFRVPENFYEYCVKDKDFENITQNLLKTIYLNLLNNTKSKYEYVGMWVDYNNKKYENSIKIESLNDIEKYGNNNINSIYEFFKMTINTKIL